MTITKPTLKDLVQLNAGALRRLGHFAQDSESEGAQFVDSLGRIVEAKPVDPPTYVGVTSRNGNVDYVGPIPERPYNWAEFDLNKKELQLVLGLDYIEPSLAAWGTSMECLNAMWKANQRCPSHDANAYLLGLFCGPRLGDFMFPVQYYCIDSKKHRELQLPMKEFKKRAGGTIK